LWSKKEVLSSKKGGNFRCRGYQGGLTGRHRVGGRGLSLLSWGLETIGGVATERGGSEVTPKLDENVTFPSREVGCGPPIGRRNRRDTEV